MTNCSACSAVDTQLRRLAAVDATWSAKSISATGAELGAATTAGLLGQLLRIAPGEAAARVRAARDLAPRRGLTGEALPPIFPAVGAALAAGEFNPAHARLIGKTIDAIPAEAEHAALGRGEQLAEQVETTLVLHATRLDPRQLGHVATRLLACLDPDGAAPREDELQRRRRLDLHTRADGSGLLHGRGRWTSITNRVLRSTRVPIAELARADDQIAFPVTGYGPVLDLGRPLADHDLGWDGSLAAHPGTSSGLTTARPVRRHAVSSRRSAPRPCTYNA